MTVHGPSFIALQVRDIDAAAAFYEQRLGLTRDPAGPPHAVVFATRPIAFALRDPLPGVDLTAVDRPGTGVVIWLAADDAEGLHADLADAGVEIVTPPADSPFGRMFTFRDPEGYAVTVHDAA